MEAAEQIEPQTLKISSKRQITIPAQWYKDKGFEDYALCTWTDDGLLIQPLKPHEDEKVMVDVLRSLIEQGLEGEDLIAEYENALSKISSMRVKLDRAEADIAAGRMGRGPEFYKELKTKHNL